MGGMRRWRCRCWSRVCDGCSHVVPYLAAHGIRLRQVAVVATSIQRRRNVEKRFIRLKRDRRTTGLCKACARMDRWPNRILNLGFCAAAGRGLRLSLRRGGASDCGAHQGKAEKIPHVRNLVGEHQGVRRSRPSIRERRPPAQTGTRANPGPSHPKTSQAPAHAPDFRTS